jgi:hypothetical protein
LGEGGDICFIAQVVLIMFIQSAAESGFQEAFFGVAGAGEIVGWVGKSCAC